MRNIEENYVDNNINITYNTIMQYSYNGKLKSKSTELRKNMTDAERKLWFEFLRTLSPRVHRQKIIGNYILDFYIASHKIGIELDGSQHFEDSTIKYDNERTEYLNKQGIRVLRYSNNDVLKNFDGVCNDILLHLGKL